MFKKLTRKKEKFVNFYKTKFFLLIKDVCSIQIYKFYELLM